MILAVLTINVTAKSVGPAQAAQSSQQTTGKVVSALPKVAYLFVNEPVVKVQALSNVAFKDS